MKGVMKTIGWVALYAVMALGWWVWVAFMDAYDMGVVAERKRIAERLAALIAP